MKHHRQRGRRARRRSLRGRAQAGGPPSLPQADAVSAVVVDPSPAAPVNGTVHPPEPPNLDAMVSALLEAEAHAAEDEAHALAEAQAHIEALEVTVPARAPAMIEDEAGEADTDAEEAQAAGGRRRSVIERPVTPVQSRQRLVYLATGIVVAVLVITVLSWMEWWDLSSVSLLPAPQ